MKELKKIIEKLKELTKQEILMLCCFFGILVMIGGMYYALIMALS
jgi:hypothetical protein